MGRGVRTVVEVEEQEAGRKPDRKHCIQPRERERKQKKQRLKTLKREGHEGSAAVGSALAQSSKLH